MRERQNTIINALDIHLFCTSVSILWRKYLPILSTDHDHFQLGTLSHIINAPANGYQELCDWPEDAPDPSVRNVEVQVSWGEEKKKKANQKKRSFYSSESSAGEFSEM